MMPRQTLIADRIAVQQHRAARVQRAIARGDQRRQRRRRDAARGAVTHFAPHQRATAERLALLRACERLLALGPAHVVVAFALLAAARGAWR